MNWTFSSGQSSPKVPVAHPNPVNLSMTPLNTSLAPPHQQPISEIGSTLSGDPTAANNLGFTTLDDWFGETLGDDTGELGSGTFAGLDLQDFWMKIGASEVGFPTALPRLKTLADFVIGSRRLSLPIIMHHAYAICLPLSSAVSRRISSFQRVHYCCLL